MIKAKSKLILAAVLSATFVLSPVLTSTAQAANDEESAKYKQHFLDLREKIHDPSNGYFREIKTSDGKTLRVPYHSVETLMVEGPDYGHETTSEGYSYYMWLEAMYGKFTNDWSAFKDAWQSADTYAIPHGVDQKGLNTYKPNDPADFINEYVSINKYPSRRDANAPVGQDPICNDLKSAYGTDEMYGMHWLLDTDNWYGYGNRGNANDTNPAYINNYQRGSSESVWKAITHPSYEKFKWGGDKGNGFLDIFNADDSYSKQWRYTIASDADARAVQATYWADQWAKEQGSNVNNEVSKATKMGDYLRYSMFDKYFREIGIGSDNQKQGTNQHYLLGWYYSWGGSDNADWSWKISCGHNHFGYQNPMTAWIMSTSKDFKPKSQNGQSDWAKSLKRQLEFYQWLQSSEGAIAGGATNSYTTDENGSNSKYPAGTTTFYGMAYDEAPVYHDPPSNQWFGMQVWSMQRIAEYFYNTGDQKAGKLLDKWVNWVKGEVHLKDDGTFEVPSNLEWSGKPDTWDGSYTGNPDLHVKVKDYSQDLGPAASLANTLMYYAAGSHKYKDTLYNGQYDMSAQKLSKELLDRMWNSYQDDKGLSSPEKRADYKKFFEQEVFVPSGYSGKMANGDIIKPGIKFIDIRSKYKKDPQYNMLKEAYDKGEDPVFHYHRFWAQSEIAIANGTYANLVSELPSPVLKGDVDGDGEVTMADSIALKKYLLNPSYKINEANSDINGDNEIDLSDLFALYDML
ncbi:glycoside hydrolase family 48 protein [Clostridium cibarium]|uniref:Endoglucanase n=1 Tax=Clostridium cibarium TaxID=2762247 RepID=A0ABR8PPV1_9CLOT|nr:endoglucanase [Clostridium cibarium]